MFDTAQTGLAIVITVKCLNSLPNERHSQPEWLFNEFSIDPLARSLATTGFLWISFTGGLASASPIRRRSM